MALADPQYGASHKMTMPAGSGSRRRRGDGPGGCACRDGRWLEAEERGSPRVCSSQTLLKTPLGLCSPLLLLVRGFFLFKGSYPEERSHLHICLCVWYTYMCVRHMPWYTHGDQRTTSRIRFSSSTAWDPESVKFVGKCLIG